MIKLFRNLLLICTAIAIIGYGTAFSYYNAQNIPLDLLFTSLPDMSAGILILASLLIGFLLALIVCSVSIARLKIRNSVLRGKLLKVQKLTHTEDTPKTSNQTAVTSAK